MIPQWVTEATLEARRKVLLDRMEEMRAELREVDEALHKRRIRRVADARMARLAREAGRTPPAPARHWLDELEDRREQEQESA